MRLAHRYNWHHMTVSYPEGALKRTCQWCGLTEVLKHHHFMGMKIMTDTRCPKDTIIITNLSIPQ